VDETQILARIRGLVDEEHDLRGAVGRGELSSEDERRRLQALEEALDQCWDLLRQRRARREANANPDDAKARPVSEVEGYLQ
jgi:hypothetical protein